MWNKFFIFMSVFYSIAGVTQSKTSVEFDNEGNEYEVKRFTIGGRQLNGGRSHCVITRRKRSQQFDAKNYGYGSENKNDDSEDNYKDTYMTYPITSHAVPLADEDSADDDLDTDNREQSDESSSDIIVDSDDKNYTHVANAELHVTQPDQTQIDHNYSSEKNDNEVIFFHFDSPPKVDPLRHAVFELLPVIFDENGLHVQNGLNNSNEKVNLENENTTTEKSNIRKRTQKPRPSNPHRNTDQLENNSSKRKKNSQKFKVQNHSLPYIHTSENDTPSRVPLKSQTVNKNQLRTRTTASSVNNKRKKSQKDNNKQTILQVTGQTKRKQQFKGNKRVGGGVVKEIVTITTTGVTDDGNDVNCIIIEKAPLKRRIATRKPTTTTTTTTTRRPFWRILGRSSGRTADAGYGRRKQANLRFFI